VAEGLEIWAIKRPDRLRHHSREIGFPGGKPEPQDGNLLNTALRETEEELAIDSSLLRVLGALAPVPTATSLFALHAFVVGLAPDTVATPAPGEVEELLTLDVQRFLRGEVPYSAVDLGGYRSPIFGFAAGAMYGASAHILEEVLEACAEASGVKMPEPAPASGIPWA
jgi:8-oxo-dGTP pyrophosphatase MutT (NUDIX family)